MRDIGQILNTTQSVLPAAARTNGTVSGTGVDLGNFDGALAVIHAGVITDGSHVVTIEESPDNSVWAAVGAAGKVDADRDGIVEPTLTTGGGNGGSRVHEIGYVGSRRFLRVKIVTSGATSGGFIDAVVVRGHARKQPT